MTTYYSCPLYDKVTYKTDPAHADIARPQVTSAYTVDGGGCMSAERNAKETLVGHIGGKQRRRMISTAASKVRLIWACRNKTVFEIITSRLYYLPTRLYHHTLLSQCTQVFIYNVYLRCSKSLKDPKFRPGPPRPHITSIFGTLHITRTPVLCNNMLTHRRRTMVKKTH